MKELIEKLSGIYNIRVAAIGHVILHSEIVLHLETDYRLKSARYKVMRLLEALPENLEVVVYIDETTSKESESWHTSELEDLKWYYEKMGEEEETKEK